MAQNDWWMQANLEERLEAFENRAGALEAGAVTPIATPLNAVAASLTTAMTGNNNDLVFSAVVPGADGNQISIELIDPGEETASESVSVVDHAIAVTLRSVSDVLSTAAQVKTAIDGNAAAAALISVANAGGNNGSGSVTELAATPLADGANGTVAPAGKIVADDSFVYIAVAANSINGQNWKRAALSSF